MPSLRDSAIVLDPARWRRLPAAPPIAAPVINPAPPIPEHLAPSPVQISSLPAISASSEGLTRQFYGRGRVPRTRIVLPGV